jgi:hypothetical protein
MARAFASHSGPNLSMPFLIAVVHLTEHVFRRYSGSMTLWELIASLIAAGPQRRAYRRSDTIGRHSALKKYTMISVSVRGSRGSCALVGGTILSRLWMPRLLMHVSGFLVPFGGPARPGVRGVFGVRTNEDCFTGQSCLTSLSRFTISVMGRCRHTERVIGVGKLAVGAVYILPGILISSFRFSLFFFDLLDSSRIL